MTLPCNSIPVFLVAAAALAGVPTSGAVESPVASALTVKLDGIRLTQDYIVDPPGNPFAHTTRDPWGVWHSGIFLRLGLDPGGGRTLLLVDQVTATAQLDSGEALGVEVNPAQNGFFDNATNRDFDAINRSRTPWFAALHLLPPQKPCARISTLSGTMRVVMGGPHLEHLHLVPTADAQAITQIPECDLTVALSAKHEIVLHFSSGHMARVHDIQFLAADGDVLTSNSTSSQGNNTAYAVTLGFQQGVPASVEIGYFATLEAATMAFSLSDVPLAGHGDPALLACTAAKVADLPVPPLTTDAANGRQPAGGGAVALPAPAHPAKPASNF
jgi:hypothetical protein